MENTIYTIVDEHVLEGLTVTERHVLKDVYYEVYCLYCKSKDIVPKKRRLFFTNMRRNKIKLVQMCCPHCGTIKIFVTDKAIKDIEVMNYCTACGKSSPEYNVLLELSKIIRIKAINDLGIEATLKKYKKYDKELVTYDAHQYEVVALASTFEKVVKDYFFAFIFLNYYGIKTDYLKRLVNDSIRNDFMDIDKAKEQYKRALGITIRDLIPNEDWEALIDLCKIRNMIVHNNGCIDEKFSNTATFRRFKDNVDSDLFFIKEENITRFYLSMVTFFDKLKELFEKSCKDNRYKIVAKYYLGKDKEETAKLVIFESDIQYK